MDKEFYVYRWYYKNINETFHIGKGKGNRYKEKSQSRNLYFKNIIKKEQDNVTSEIIQDNLTELQAWKLEKLLIAKYKAKGLCKTNFHEGGCGGYTGNYDSLERSRKISEAAKKRIGLLNPMYGKHHTEEAKQKIGAAQKGKTLSKEHKAKLLAANLGRKKTSELIEKLRKALTGRKMSELHKANMMNSLCKYEYQIYLNNKLLYTCLGQTAVLKYCKENFNISRAIIEKVIKNNWKPTFNKHKYLETLKILKIERCIDLG